MSNIGEKINKLYTSNAEVDSIKILENQLIYDSLLFNNKLKRPFYLTWNITNKCNLSCIYCSNKGDYTTDKVLNYIDMISAIDNINKLGIKHIRLLGGEPTLISNFNGILDYILSKNIYLSMSTNGIGINKNTINVLKKYSPLKYSINVSLDSLSREENALNRGESSYDIALQAINLINSIENVNLTVYSVITKNNEDSLYRNYLELNKMKIKNYGGTIALLKGTAEPDMILKINEELIDTLLEIKKISAQKEENTNFYFNLGYRESDEVSYNKKKMNLKELESDYIFRKNCNVGITRLHMESNGDIYPCDHLKFNSFYLGNINDSENLESLWDNSIIDMIWRIRRSDKENCKSCIHKSCGTGCMGLAYKKNGTLLLNDPNCKMVGK
ncbi:MAG: radical SAM protein [Tissierellia bacterium]|nr:radical SAM protein [Tissierellia bacterium]